jgi:hypothetical protein
MVDNLNAVLLLLSALFSQQHESIQSRGHQEEKSPSQAMWKRLTLEDLPEDDRILWHKYHDDNSPGIAVVRNKCFKHGIQFIAQIRVSPRGLEERVTYSSRGKLRLAFESRTVTTPFVIWTAPSGISKDVVTGKSYNVQGQSLIFEKMESIAYQYMCYRGSKRTIITAD